MRLKLIYLFLSATIVFASSGYDNGLSAGKGNWDISLTINPYNYFSQGQNYIVLGYGLTNKIDLHGYYSKSKNQPDNYYTGIFYQFYKSNKLNLSTAFGVRKYSDNKKSHYFFPQLLFTYIINNKLSFEGSSVEIREISNKNRLGTAHDLSLKLNIKENKKYNLSFSFGFFNPALWKPNSGEWHPTYSINLKIKR